VSVNEISVGTGSEIPDALKTYHS